MPRICMLMFALVCGAMGCQARQVARDGVNFRQALLTMYTDQAMDNLIRAKTNQPFVQIAYRNLTVQDLDSLSGTGSLSLTDTSAQTTGATIAASVVRTFSNAIGMGGTAGRSRTMSFQADPITDQNDIYLLYRGFALEPGLFVESDCKPEGPVHIMRKSGGKYYWVPCEAAPVFFDLVMRTTFMRGPDIQRPPYYDCKIARVLLLSPGKKYDKVMIELSPSIPNGEADMDLTVKGKRRRIPLLIVDVPLELAGEKFEPKPEGVSYPQKYFVANLNKEELDIADAKELQGLSVQVFSRKYPPEPIKISPELKRIEANQDLIRINLNNLLSH